MKTELVQALTTTFEAYAQQTESGIEFWLARDLQYLLGYTKWDNFLNVVSKARTACEVPGMRCPIILPTSAKRSPCRRVRRKKSLKNPYALDF